MSTEAFHGLRKSSACTDAGCVFVGTTESAVVVDGGEQVDSNTRRFTHEEWNAFLEGMKRGEFNLADNTPEGVIALVGIMRATEEP